MKESTDIIKAWISKGDHDLGTAKITYILEAKMKLTTIKSHKSIFIISFIIIGIIYIIFVTIYDNYRLNKHYKKYYQSNIIGAIYSKKVYMRSGFRITLKSGEVFYVFPEMNNLNHFENNVQPGDSIFKKAFTDTLLVQKNNKTYRYSMEVFDD